MSDVKRRVLIANDRSDAAAFMAASGEGAARYEAVVVWRGAPDDGGLVSVADLADPKELWAPALEDAGGVVIRLVESGWWEVDGINVARLLRDLVAREMGQQVRAIVQVERVADGFQPAELHVPLPLKRAYYVADGMMAESARLVAERRGIGIRLLGGQIRRLRAATEDLKWRMGLRTVRDRYVKQALFTSKGASITQVPRAEDASRTVCVGPCWAAELQSHRPISDLLRECGWRVVFFDIPFYYTRDDWRDDALSGLVAPLGKLGGGRALESATKVSEELCRRFRDGEQQRRHRELFEAAGVNLLDSAYVAARLTRLLTVEARIAVAMYVSGRAMCEAVKPALLLSMKAEGPEVRGLMGAAQDLGVPVVYAPHGVHGDDPRWDDILADLILADGQSFAEKFIRRTGREADVRVIGTPKHDAVLKGVPSPHAPLPKGEAQRQDDGGRRQRRRAGSPCHETDGGPSVWIGVATTDRTEYDLKNVEAAAAFAKAHGDAAVLVKTHPRLSQSDLLHRFERAAGSTGKIVSHGDVMQVLRSCDVVVTGVSTAAIETMAVGVPVAYVGSVHDDVHGYARAGAVRHVERHEELGEALGELLEDEEQREALASRGREFAEHKLGPLDGRAAERAVAELERLVRRGGIGNERE